MAARPPTATTIGPRRRSRDPRLACFGPWGSIGASRRLDVPHLVSKSPGTPGAFFSNPCSGGHRTTQATASVSWSPSRPARTRGDKSRPIAPYTPVGPPGLITNTSHFQQQSQGKRDPSLGFWSHIEAQIETQFSARAPLPDSWRVLKTRKDSDSHPPPLPGRWVDLVPDPVKRS